MIKRSVVSSKVSFLEQTSLLFAGGVTDEGALPGETMRLILSLKGLSVGK